MARRREYTITISALLGRSTAAVLGDFVAQAERAKKQVDDIMSRPSRVAPSGESGAAKEAKSKVDEAKKAAAELARIREKENDQILKDVEKHVKAEERAAAQIAKIKERYFVEEQRRGEKADAERAKRNKQIVSDSFGNMAKVASVTSRVAGELTSGFGVSFDLSSAMQRGSTVDETARRTTLSGFGAKDKNATERDVQETADVIKKAGDETKQSYGALAKGLEDFVSKSSDLETGKTVLADLGRIARATGTDVNELVSAAGDVNKTLEDGPDKAEKLLEVMTLVATQSAKGAVEVKDFARYMGRITAGAFKFEGSRAQNIGILSALAQVAMSGGASGPREATNAAQAFSNDITKGRALERFQSAGIELFTDKNKTTLRTPEKIITDYLRKSGGNLADLAKFFQNEGSRRVITGFAQKFNAAGGGEAGIQAVQAEFKKFSETMSAQDVQKRFELSAEGRAAKAQEFQNKLDTIADSLATRVLPAFEKMAPVAEDVAKALAGVVAWAASNPMASVGIAVAGSITASIAKAAIGDVLGKALASGIGSVNPALGLLAAAAVAAAIAIQQYIAAADEAEGKTKKDIEQDVPTLIAKAQKQLKETGTVDKETINDIARKRAELGAARAMEEKTEFGKEKLGLTATIFAGKDVAEAEGTLAATSGKSKEIDALTAKMDAFLAEFIKANPPKPKGPMEVKIVGGLVVAAPGTPAPAGTVDH